MSALDTHPTIASFFSLKRALGSGSYGEVYEAVDTRTRARVAIKLEPVGACFPQLVYEHRVLQELASYHGFPRVIWFESNDEYNVMIMQKLGKSVEEARMAAGGTLPIKQVIDIGRQVLERLACCHARGIAYRDMKPQNMLFGLPKLLPDGTDACPIYLIDFGLCKRVLDPESGAHVPIRNDKKLAGTPRYASLNAHKGIEQARRDDVESLMYVLIFLAKGTLPWQSSPTNTNDCSTMSKLLKTVGRIKERVTVPELCDGLPPIFSDTLTYARNMVFDAMPDYTFLNATWGI